MSNEERRLYNKALTRIKFYDENRILLILIFFKIKINPVYRLTSEFMYRVPKMINKSVNNAKCAT